MANLRSRLPAADQDQEAVNAAELRRHFEAPPFGWDGNCIKVGLALLLRESECRFFDDSRIVDNPSSDEAERILTTESRFRHVRVQGVRSQLTPTELRAIRDAMRATFNVPNNLAIIAPALNTALGEQLAGLASRAAEVQTWTSAAQCPVPQNFLAGVSATHELLNIGAAERRLLAYRDQHEGFQHFVDVLARLENFRQEHDARFRTMRDFYNSMINAASNLAEVQTFLRDYRTVEQEGSLTEPARWHELNQSYTAAQSAVAAQIEAWRGEAEAQLAGLNARLEEAVRGAGVPEEQVRDEAAALSTLYEPVRRRLERDARTFGEARLLLNELWQCEDEKSMQLRELQTRYAPAPAANEAGLSWQELVTQPVRIDSQADLDAWLAEIRDRVDGYLQDGKTVIIQ